LLAIFHVLTLPFVPPHVINVVESKSILTGGFVPPCPEPKVCILPNGDIPDMTSMVAPIEIAI